MGMGIPEHLEVAFGYLAFALHPVVASYPYHTFFGGGGAGQPGEFLPASSVFFPVCFCPHVPANDMELDRGFAFHKPGPVEPGFLSTNVVVSIADVDTACESIGGVYDHYFMVH